MKKKLSMLAALATVVTIGGVYATWTFAEKDAPAASTTVNVAMTGIEGSTEKGTIAVKVMDTNGFSVAIDDSNNDHYAEILKTGVITVVFTPSATAPLDVQTNGIDIALAISVASRVESGGPTSIADWTYDGKQIFSVEHDADNPNILRKEEAHYDASAKTFTWTIEYGDVCIELANQFYIDTLEKYNAMNTELNKGKFVVTAEETVAPPVQEEAGE